MSDNQQVVRQHRQQYNRATFEQKKLLIKLVCVEGRTIRESAHTIGLNESTARNIIRNYKREGGLVERKRGGNNKEKLTAEVLRRIEEVVERHPQHTLMQIQRVLEDENVVLSVSTIFNALKKLRITLKRCHRELDRVNCETTIANRKAYALDFSNHAPQDKEKCVFIDECGFTLHLRRREERLEKRKRANVVVPTVRGRMVTLIVAMSNAGILHWKITSDGTCNSAKFCEFMEELMERVREIEAMNGAWLIMDNARILEADELRAILGSSYHLKFLSPYSYMLNPAENVSSKVKASAKRLLSSLTEDRTLTEVIEESVHTVSQQDCADYVLHMKMNLTKAAAGGHFSTT